MSGCISHRGSPAYGCTACDRTTKTQPPVDGWARITDESESPPHVRGVANTVSVVSLSDSKNGPWRLFLGEHGVLDCDNAAYTTEIARSVSKALDDLVCGPRVSRPKTALGVPAELGNWESYLCVGCAKLIESAGLCADCSRILAIGRQPARGGDQQNQSFPQEWVRNYKAPSSPYVTVTMRPDWSGSAILQWQSNEGMQTTSVPGYVLKTICKVEGRLFLEESLDKFLERLDEEPS